MHNGGLHLTNNQSRLLRRSIRLSLCPDPTIALNSRFEEIQNTGVNMAIIVTACCTEHLNGLFVLPHDLISSKMYAHLFMNMVEGVGKSMLDLLYWE